MLHCEREQPPLIGLSVGNLRDEVHRVGVTLDALLPVLGEVSQHLQRHEADGDVVHVGPGLQGNQHHARV